VRDAQGEQPDRPVFYRIDVANVTRMTAPRYGTITYTDRNSVHVLAGHGDLLLIGPMGVNYHVEGSNNDVIFLRRWDQPTVKGHGHTTIFRTLRGESPGNTYKGPETTPAPAHRPFVAPGRPRRP